MTPQEQVKTLREGLEKARAALVAGSRSIAEATIDKALAATASLPRFVFTHGKNEVHDNVSGVWVCVFQDGVPMEHRQCVLDSLNALAEKENAR